jgi:Domain of unknown function (DUF4105)
MKRFLLFLIPLLFVFNCFSQQIKLSNNATISILTCDTGAELYSLYGHTAIRINDPINGIDFVGNFGTFDFNTPNFYLKFIKGDLQYFGTYSTFEEFISEYEYLKRGVYEQVLNLSASQKQALFDELKMKLTSNDKFYTYKFIDKNCTTLIADLLQKHINGQLSLKIKDSSSTNRTILYNYAKNNHFFENLGINILFGYPTDKKLYKLFLPLQFLESIKISKNNEVSLASETKILLTGNTTEPSFSLWNNWFVFVLFCVLIVFLNKKWIDTTYFILLGLLGIFLATLGFYSLHQEVRLNYNILLFNPLYLFLVFFIIKNYYKYARKIAYLIMVLTVIYLLFIVAKVQFLMFLPLITVNFILLYRRTKQAKLLTTVK